jgi:hypothetical protein
MSSDIGQQAAVVMVVVGMLVALAIVGGMSFIVSVLN